MVHVFLTTLHAIPSGQLEKVQYIGRSAALSVNLTSPPFINTLILSISQLRKAKKLNSKEVFLQNRVALDARV